MSSFMAVLVAVWLSAPTNQDGELTVLLLTDGRVLQGKVERVGDGFLVRRPYGQIHVPAEKVERAFPSLEAAYRWRREQLNGGEASEYAELALWCLRYKLFDAARDCVREALRIEPGNPKLQRLLRQVETLERLHRQQLHRKTERPVRLTSATVTGTAPLRPEAVRQFARRVQPLITRRCSAVGCHGPSTRRTFPLWPSTVPGPAVTHYNINVLMRYVDLQDPAKSPLLLKAITPHGGSNRPPLTLPRQRKAYETLQRWIELVADQTKAPPPTSHEPPAPVAPRELPPEFQPGPETPTEEADPFDPTEFNRQVNKEQTPDEQGP